MTFSLLFFCQLKNSNDNEQLNYVFKKFSHVIKSQKFMCAYVTWGPLASRIRYKDAPPIPKQMKKNWGMSYRKIRIRLLHIFYT